MSRLFPRLRLVLLGVLLVASGRAAPLSDALRSYLRDHSGPETQGLIFLCEKRSAGRTEQSLISMSDVRKTRGASGSGLGIAGLFSKTLYTSTGHEYSFPDDPVEMDVWTCLPASENGGVKVVRTVHKLNRLYLEAGLFEAAALFDRMRQRGKQDPKISFFLKSGFSEEQRARDIKEAAAQGFTEDDERIYATSLFGLIQFAAVAFKTKGLDDILESMVNKPGIFSGAYTQLDWASLSTETGKPGPVYHVNFGFQSSSSITGQLQIERPAGELLRCGGFTGLTIQTSSKNPGTILEIRRVFSEEWKG